MTTIELKQTAPQRATQPSAKDDRKQTSAPKPVAKLDAPTVEALMRKYDLGRQDPWA